MFSAHGVSPSVHDQAQRRNLKAIDATCPLVTKVHHEARRFANSGYQILLIGHEGHEEVEGRLERPRGDHRGGVPGTPTASNWIRIGRSHGCPRPRCPSMKPCRRWTVCASGCRC